MRNGNLLDFKTICGHIANNLRDAFQKKQAENGLQSQPAENGKTAVWHYGLKLQ